MYTSVTIESQLLKLHKIILENYSKCYTEDQNQLENMQCNTSRATQVNLRDDIKFQRQYSCVFLLRQTHGRFRFELGHSQTHAHR